MSKAKPKKEIGSNNGANGSPLSNELITDRVEKHSQVLSVLKYASEIDITHPEFWKGRIKTADKFTAIAAYMVYGSAMKAERYVGYKEDRKPIISHNTIRQWKHSAPWWSDVTKAIMKAQSEEFDQTSTYIIQRAQEETIERLDNGDEAFDKAGNIVRKKISGKDAQVIAAMAFDKRALSRGQATNITEQKSHNGRLRDIEKTLRAFGMESKLIEGEVIDY